MSESSPSRLAPLTVDDDLRRQYGLNPGATQAEFDARRIALDLRGRLLLLPEATDKEVRDRLRALYAARIKEILEIKPAEKLEDVLDAGRKIHSLTLEQMRRVIEEVRKEYRLVELLGDVTDGQVIEEIAAIFGSKTE